MTYDYEYADWEGLNKNLTETNGDEILEHDSIDEQAINRTQKYMTIIKQHIPNKVVTTTPLTNPWINNKIINARRKKKKLFKRASTTNSQKDKRTLKWRQRKSIQT